MGHSNECEAVQIVDAGCDWLTLTVKPGKSLAPVFERWEHLQRKAREAGHAIEDHRRPRYTGTIAGGVAILGRSEDMCFEAQGAIANEALKLMKGIGFDGNISRADFQVTFEGPPALCPLPKDYYLALQAPEAGQEAHTRVYMDVRRSPRTGSTLYVGAPSSDSRCRYYCAGIVHPGRYRAGALRDEWQTRNDVARHTYTAAQEAKSLTEFAAAAVMGRLQKWGIERAWYGNTAPLKPHSGWKATTEESFAAYVQKCIVPKVRESIGKGNGDIWAEIFGVVSMELRGEVSKGAFLAPLALNHHSVGVVSGSEAAKREKPKRYKLVSATHSKTKAKSLGKEGLS